MKAKLFQGRDGAYLVLPGKPDITDATFVGTIEIEEPKKIVKHEANPFYIDDNGHDIRYTFVIPLDAQNVKCTYEMEE
jgi:hypothetical protein